MDGEAKMIMEKGALGLIQKPYNCSYLAMAVKETIAN